jgi:hypothetical protein
MDSGVHCLPPPPLRSGPAEPRVEFTGNERDNDLPSHGILSNPNDKPLSRPAAPTVARQPRQSWRMVLGGGGLRCVVLGACFGCYSVCCAWYRKHRLTFVKTPRAIIFDVVGARQHTPPTTPRVHDVRPMGCQPLEHVPLSHGLGPPRARARAPGFASELGDFGRLLQAAPRSLACRVRAGRVDARRLGLGS